MATAKETGLANSIDPNLVRAWLEGRSIARNLPAPVPDLGGFRVDTNSEAELCRWVFAGLAPQISVLASMIHGPEKLIKVCAARQDVERLLPEPWVVESANAFMALDGAPPALRPLPSGYRIERSRNGAALMIEIITEEGEVAASGYAAETMDAFVYDRIVTREPHRKKGLGRALMAALGSSRRSAGARQLLVATMAGERLYSALGWQRISPYSTARLPIAQAPSAG